MGSGSCDRASAATAPRPLGNAAKATCHEGKANACSEYSAVQCEYSAVRRERTHSSGAAQRCGSILLAGTKLQAERHSGLKSRSDRTMPTVRRAHPSVGGAPASAGGTRASRTHGHKARAACMARKLTRPKTPAEAALCFEPRANTVTRTRRPNVPELAIASCAYGRPMQDRDRCRLEVGWMRL
jgi:hypothetical protein